jgi:hypothetical protein
MSTGDSRESLITYCGLFCGDCPGYKGAIADRARELKAELEAEEFARAAEFFGADLSMATFGKYPTFSELLDVLENLRCPQICRERAEHKCEIVNCCRSKSFEGCWECAEVESCGKIRSDILTTLHHGKNIDNLRMLKNDGRQAFCAGERYWFGRKTNG